MSLEKLEQKVQKKSKVAPEPSKESDPQLILDKLDRNYREISEVKSIVRNDLVYIEQKINFIVDAIKASGTTEQDIQRSKKIKRLERELEKLKGGK